MLEVELALAHRLRRNDMASDVSLKGISHTNLEVIGVHTGHVISVRHDGQR